MQTFTKLSSFLLLATFITSAFATLLPCTDHNENSEWAPESAWPSGNSGYISRNSGKATKSLCRVYYPAGLSGKTCKLVFENPDWASGSRRGQVFTLGSANIDSAAWNAPGEAHQDNHIGTFELHGSSWPWGKATFIEFGTFPCPETEGAKGYAIVPTWDEDYISWWSPNGGLKVEYLP